MPRALGRLRVALEDAYLRASRELGLTPQQAELLCASRSPVAVGELAEVLRCDSSNVSRLVDRGVLRGLLTRQAGQEDGRVTLVELTPDGEQLAGRFLAALETQTQALRAGWPAQRRKLAAEVLNEIADALDAAKPAPGRGRTKRLRGPGEPADLDPNQGHGAGRWAALDPNQREGRRRRSAGTR